MKNSKFYKLLNKDVKELNGIVLLLFCILILFASGILSYKITSSYALFSDEVLSNNVIEAKVSNYYNQTTLFSFKEKAQEYVVPKDGYYYIEMGGASGPVVNDRHSNGAKTSGYIELKKGEKLYFYVGKQGTALNTNCRTSGYEFNGGGIAMPSKDGLCGPTGGGATDVRLVDGAWDDMSSLISRIMVAGGAGSPDNVFAYTLGHGGTLYGEQVIFSDYQQYLANPGTQVSGGAAPTKYNGAQSTGTAGSFGKGGYGGANQSTSTSGGGSGGGSGYYGASGSSGLSNGFWGGSGGSSYISGYAGVNSVKESTTITHTNQTLHYSGKYFIGGKMISGQNEGNGYAKITYVESKPKKRTTKLDNVRYIKDCSSFNSINNGNHWVELQAIKDGINIAKGKSVVGSHAEDSGYPYSRITDGEFETYSAPLSYTTNQCVTVDLGSTYDLDEIAVWNYFRDQRSYYDNITYVSDDNSTWTTIINEANIQSSNGRRINVYTDNLNGYVQDNLNLWLDGYANNGGARVNSLSAWKDLSGTGNNATVNSGSWGANYLNFAGASTHYATIPYSSTLAPPEFTIDLTFSKLGIVNNSRSVLFVKWSGYTIELNTDNTVVFGTRNATDAFPYLSGGVIDLNRTYNVVATYKNNVEKIYVNGELKNSRTNTSSAFSHSSTEVSIGKYSTSGYSNVNINQIKFYNKALTDDEIKHNYLMSEQTFYIK